MKTGDDAGPAPTYVTESDTPLGAENPPAFDVVVCGGTLGIFVATALQMRYHMSTTQSAPTFVDSLSSFDGRDSRRATWSDL